MSAIVRVCARIHPYRYRLGRRARAAPLQGLRVPRVKVSGKSAGRGAGRAPTDVTRIGLVKRGFSAQPHSQVRSGHKRRVRAFKVQTGTNG
jgi:hypothetical protein